ncbi:uncharacterized protein LOC111862339 isoform X2 [Cryptotermes secundus]|uniref:uncharacterized protein LOC111862339 isoform X2 n=1 Tax=Cryptotermes secundus TaxID=105785 RepID=UPI001454DD5A|nr:uncharacterized protein LOC111862339 isoform X2 [Cryptotermes secundus]
MPHQHLSSIMYYHDTCCHYKSVCNCSLCWKEFAQCPISDLCADNTQRLQASGVLLPHQSPFDDEEDTTYNIGSLRVRTTNVISLDRSNIKQITMANIHNSGRQNNNSPSKEIYSLWKYAQPDDPGTSTGIFGPPPRASHTIDSTRTIGTPKLTPPSSPSSHQEPTTIGDEPDNISHQHIQQTSAPSNFPSSDTNIRDNTIHDGDTGRINKRTSVIVLNKRLRSCDNSPPRNQIKQRRTSISNATIDGHLQHSDDGTPSPPSPSIPADTTGNNDPSGSSPILLQPTSASTDLYYTFILHKTTFDALPPTSKKSPTFATFDHGDHIHIIFSVRHSNNVSRHLNSILSFLKTGFSGNAEAHTSLQLIRYTTRFISYLIRKGISTFNKYGNKSLSIIKPILDAIARYDVTDSSPDNMPCQQYVEEKKTIIKENLTQRTN